MSHPRLDVLSQYSSSTIRTAASLEEGTSDLIAGSAGLAQLLHIGTGIAMATLDLLPYAGLLIAAAGVFKALDESYHAPKSEKVKLGNIETHFKSLVTLITSGALGVYSVENLGQAMTLGSQAFGTMCGGMAIKAAGDFVTALYDFRKAYMKYTAAKKALLEEDSSSSYEEDSSSTYDAVDPKVVSEFINARNKLIINTANFLGWGLLALAPVATPAAMLPLMAIGFTALIVAGLYAGYTAYQNYSAVLTPAASEREKAGATKWTAFRSLFWSPAYGAAGEELSVAEADERAMKPENLLRKKGSLES